MRVRRAHATVIPLHELKQTREERVGLLAGVHSRLVAEGLVAGVHLTWRSTLSVLPFH